MNEQTLNKQLEAGNVALATPSIPASPDSIPAGTIKLEDFLSVLELLRRPRAYLEDHPTWIPKNYTESIQFVKDGSDLFLDVYFDGDWQQIPISVSTPPPASLIQTYTPAAAATVTLDLSLGNIHHIEMPAGNVTIALDNETEGQCFIVRILQDGAGGRTVTWFSGISWAGGVAPVLSTGANKADTFGFEVTAAGAYDGFIVGQYI